MNEAYMNAIVTSLETQRNNALNGLVKAEAALAVTTTRNSELEAQVKALTPVNPTMEDSPA